jgi:hypothetical protein
MSRLGRHNGEFVWDDSTISIAYSFVCSGKTQLTILAEAHEAELPEISRSTLIRYLTYFSTKYNYPPARKGMSLPWEGFTFDGIPLCNTDWLHQADCWVCEGHKTDTILQEARKVELPSINTRIFWKYMSWFAKQTGKPFPRKGMVI